MSYTEGVIDGYNTAQEQVKELLDSDSEADAVIFNLREWLGNVS